MAYPRKIDGHGSRYNLQTQAKTTVKQKNSDELYLHLGRSTNRTRVITEGSLEVKLPTIWTDEKQSREEAERRGRLEERRLEERRVEEKE